MGQHNKLKTGQHNGLVGKATNSRFVCAYKNPPNTVLIVPTGGLF